MHALLVIRKGDVVDVIVDTDVTKLKAEAAKIDGSPLTWQSVWGNHGAHSNNDEEKVYEILQTRTP